MRLPPSNIEAEQSILGSILLDKDAIIKVAEIISEEDFYQENHQKIYKTMLDLSRRDVVCDIVTVSENMEELDSVGGIGYLSDLASSTKHSQRRTVRQDREREIHIAPTNKRI